MQHFSSPVTKDQEFPSQSAMINTLESSHHTLTHQASSTPHSTVQILIILFNLYFYFWLFWVFLAAWAFL